MAHHDISSGLRENWNAKRKWKMAISGVQAAIRMTQVTRAGGSASSSRRVSIDGARPAVANGDHTDEYDTATEDEGARTDEEGGPMIRQRSLSLIQRSTTDQTAKRVSIDLKKDLDGKMAQLQKKTEELNTRRE